MNRSTARDILRRRLNDPVVGGQFSDAELNFFINQGLTLVEKEILKIRAYGFLQWELYDLTANQQRYPLTVGSLYPVYVGYRGASTGTFTKLDRKNMLAVLDGSESGYAHAGREIILSSSLVTATVSQGLRVIHVPAIELADDVSTTEDKGIPMPLDLAAVVWAQELATPETGEGRKEAAAERMGLLADLPLYLRTDGDGPEYLKFDFVKYPSGVR